MFRAARGEFLGIVQAVGNRCRIEDDGGGDDRAGKRPAAGLVDAGDVTVAAFPVAGLNLEVGHQPRQRDRRKGEANREAFSCRSWCGMTSTNLADALPIRFGESPYGATLSGGECLFGLSPWRQAAAAEPAGMEGTTAPPGSLQETELLILRFRRFEQVGAQLAAACC